MQRILHIDMDAFYAAIEIIDDPSLRGKPVIVGSPPDQRGVVSTASYEARKFGVRSAMPSRTAGRLCPTGIFLPPRMGRYLEVSEHIMQIIETFSPMIETVSVDEAFVDIGGILRRYGTAKNVALEMKSRIRTETGLTASVGVAPNKFLAKLGSDLNKPDGLTIVPEEPEAIWKFLEPLPVSRIWGVGKVTGEALARQGITLIGHIQQWSVARLSSLLGPVLAEHIHELAFGRDQRPVVTEYEAKSISSENTFLEDCSDRDVLRQTLVEQVEHVGRRLRRSGKLARVGQLKLRYDDFQTVTRQQTFDAPTSSDRNFIACALGLFEKQKVSRPIRLIGFGVSDFPGGDSAVSDQPFLFAEMDPNRRSEKDTRLDRAVDRLRDQFGESALKRGASIAPDKKRKSTGPKASGRAP